MSEDVYIYLYISFFLIFIFHGAKEELYLFLTAYSLSSGFTQPTTFTVAAIS